MFECWSSGSSPRLCYSISPTLQADIALDPRTKLLASLMLIMAILLVEKPTGILMMGVLLVLVMRLSHTSFKIYGQNLLLISWLLTATFLTHVWGRATVLPGSNEAFTAGGIALGRLSIMLGWVTILGRSSSPLELVSGIEQLCIPLRRVGVPIQKFSLIVMLSIRFLPLLFEEGQHLLHAYLARGFGWHDGALTVRVKHIGALFLPLFSHLLRRVEHLTLAMENRAFQLDAERTSLYILRMGFLDYCILCACLPALFCGYIF